MILSARDRGPVLVTAGSRGWACAVVTPGDEDIMVL